MAIGEKYAPLGKWLKEHGGDSVKLTFDELNQIIPIPNHAYKNRPSWANLSNPASFCSSWISAGYVVDSISLEEQWVVFRKGEVQGHTHHSKPPYRVVDQKKLAEAIHAGYECYDSIHLSAVLLVMTLLSWILQQMKSRCHPFGWHLFYHL